MNISENFCEERGCEFALSEVWAKGGDGGVELWQKKVLEDTWRTRRVDYPSAVSG